MPRYSALFVCLGNICRSPIAEACFKQLLQEKGLLRDWYVDSAATAFHDHGNEPHCLGQICMRAHGVFHHVEKHRSRSICTCDFDVFDYIFCMDQSNMRELMRMAPRREHRAKIFMLGSYDHDKTFRGIIEDPLCSSGVEDFEVVYGQCWRSCLNFIDSIHCDCQECCSDCCGQQDMPPPLPPPPPPRPPRPPR